MEQNIAVENKTPTNHMGSWLDKIWWNANNQPIAMVEARHESSALVDINADPGMQAVVAVAEAAQLPLFGLRYPTGNAWISLSPLNRFALKALRKPAMMNQAEFLRFRGQLQGIMHQPIHKKLN